MLTYVDFGDRTTQLLGELSLAAGTRLLRLVGENLFQFLLFFFRKALATCH